MLPCPRCRAEGYKQLEDFTWWFNCPACLFRCLMGNYSYQLKIMSNQILEDYTYYLHEIVHRDDPDEIIKTLNFEQFKKLEEEEE